MLSIVSSELSTELSFELHRSFCCSSCSDVFPTYVFVSYGSCTSVKGQNDWYTKQGCRLDWYPSIRVLATCCQLRFALYSRAVITKALATVVSLLLTSGLWLCEVILYLMPLA